MQWLVELLATEYGALGILCAVLLAGFVGLAGVTLSFYRRINYLTELCLRLAQNSSAETGNTAARLARSFASGTLPTAQALALDTESDWSMDLRPLQDPEDTPTIDFQRR